MMFTIIALVIVAVEAAIIGMFWLVVINPLWALYLRHERAEEKKVHQLGSIMEKASTLGLNEAVDLLKCAGIYFDSNRELGWGNRFVLPKYFWMGSIYPQAVLIRAKTLVTLATHAFASTENTKAISGELLLTIFGQTKKNPNWAMAVQTELIQQVLQNQKFAVMFDSLKYHRVSWF